MSGQPVPVQTQGTLALDIRSVSMSFGPVRVLNGASFDVTEGEVHGLLGANGAGKSTLVKVLAGFHQPAADTDIQLWGRRLDFPMKNPEGQGIVVVHQDLGLVDSLTVLENFGAPMRFGAGRLRPIGWRRLRRRLKELLDELGVEALPDVPVSSLSPTARASIAIMRSLESARWAGAERVLMILDEPTVYLGHAQRGALFRMVRALTKKGDSAIFISHRLQEVLDFCDRISVLRDGVLVSTRHSPETTPQELVHDMLGYSIEQFYPDFAGAVSDSSVLRLSGLSGGQLSELSMEVAAGEIVGVTGLPGAGHEDLPRLLAGLDHATSGAVVLVGGQPKRLGSRQLLARDLVVVPADRHRDGVWLEGTAMENLTLGTVDQFFRRGFLRGGAERKYSGSTLSRYGVRPPEPSRQMRTFSGGNQQKIVLARALERRPKILVLHEATQGVDAGGKRDILELISNAAESGVAVIMCSSDYEELANVCHRVLILREGRAAAWLEGELVTEDAIAHATQI